MLNINIDIKAIGTNMAIPIDSLINSNIKAINITDIKITKT